ncbi:MAG: SagB/ThcOx family dehydrogenase [Dehalococcoidia bacterium]
MERSSYRRRLMGQRMSRRDLLRAGVAAGVGVAVAGLTACDGADEAPPPAARGTPTQAVSIPAAQDTPLARLPDPLLKGEMSLEEAISRRRSRREFEDHPLTPGELSQILWAAQGITDQEGLKRATPSAGALYPLDLYVVVGKQGVEGLREGAYHYLPQSHSLELLSGGDSRQALAQHASEQMFIAEAPVIVVVTAEYQRTTKKYGERGVRYVHIEAGHVGQDICLQVQALGLATVTIGAFQDEEVSRTLGLPPNHEPLYIIPVGHPKL